MRRNDTYLRKQLPHWTRLSAAAPAFALLTAGCISSPQVRPESQWIPPAVSARTQAPQPQQAAVAVPATATVKPDSQPRLTSIRPTQTQPSAAAATLSDDPAPAQTTPPVSTGSISFPETQSMLKAVAYGAQAVRNAGAAPARPCSDLRTTGRGDNSITVAGKQYKIANVNSRGRKYGGEWSEDYSNDIRSMVTPAMLHMDSKRVALACPRFGQLNDSQKRDFWAAWFQSLSSAESGHKLDDSFLESNFENKDEVTKMPVYSEGLLQLSYQDRCPYISYQQDVAAHLRRTGKSRSQFDFEQFRKDPQRDMLNPFINLRCGIWKTDQLLRKFPNEDLISMQPKGKHFYNSAGSRYWSTLNPKFYLKKGGDQTYWFDRMLGRENPGFAKFRSKFNEAIDRNHYNVPCN